MLSRSASWVSGRTVFNLAQGARRICVVVSKVQALARARRVRSSTGCSIPGVAAHLLLREITHEKERYHVPQKHSYSCILLVTRMVLKPTVSWPPRQSPKEHKREPYRGYHDGGLSKVGL